MKFFPESALVQLEFEKVKTLLALQCRTDYAKAKAGDLRIHTKKDFIETDLQQSNEYKILLQSSQYFPNDFILNLQKELKLLAIPGAVLKGEDFLRIKNWQKIRVTFSGGLIMKTGWLMQALQKLLMILTTKK